MHLLTRLNRVTKVLVGGMEVCALIWTPHDWPLLDSWSSRGRSHYPCKQTCVGADHDSSPPCPCQHISYTRSSDYPAWRNPPAQSSPAWLSFAFMWDLRGLSRCCTSSKSCNSMHLRISRNVRQAAVDCISLNLPLNYARRSPWQCGEAIHSG